MNKLFFYIQCFYNFQLQIPIFFEKFSKFLIQFHFLVTINKLLKYLLLKPFFQYYQFSQSNPQFFPSKTKNYIKKPILIIKLFT